MSKKCENGCPGTLGPNVKFCNVCGGKAVEVAGSCSCGFVNENTNSKVCDTFLELFPSLTISFAPIVAKTFKSTKF